ncbi:hypothetical protein KY495_17545 [Massilia sp. PAMC28688]|uniref:hypothetical protein n=1 Tax=Massilia sp. PAMC28688 TaxID=2861283 RepID=UPI001C62C073|nr:hypothetical protein [Massilia sp. PAMC28688]QYF92533.1 hypothetical protein KY495_17545 [Massilia sp. PAMC28688]
MTNRARVAPQLAGAGAREIWDKQKTEVLQSKGHRVRMRSGERGYSQLISMNFARLMMYRQMRNSLGSSFGCVNAMSF